MPSHNFIYTDKCSEASKTTLMEKLGLRVHIRDELIWDLSYITSILTNPSIQVVVLGTVDEKAIAEMTLAAFMCKPILVTTNAVKEYTYIYPFTTDLEPGCNLETDNNSFVNWYIYTIRR